MFCRYLEIGKSSGVKRMPSYSRWAFRRSPPHPSLIPHLAHAAAPATLVPTASIIAHAGLSTGNQPSKTYLSDQYLTIPRASMHRKPTPGPID
jgi:hypothetical protein